MTHRGFTLLLCCALLAGAVFFTGCGPEKQVRPSVANLREYQQQAHARQMQTTQSPGSLFNQAQETRDLFSDFRARYVDDIVVIQVLENTNALSSADASTKNSSDMNNSITALGGLEKHVGELANLAGGTGSKDFSGQGTTNRKTVLSTTITARVVDVMPNGNLVIEGTKQVNINNENQVVTLTGVIRPRDISSDNIIPSTAIANLQVHLTGQGLVTKSLKPGWLFKILSGLLPL